MVIDWKSGHEIDENVCINWYKYWTKYNISSHVPSFWHNSDTSKEGHGLLCLFDPKIQKYTPTHISFPNTQPSPTLHMQPHTHKNVTHSLSVYGKGYDIAYNKVDDISCVLKIMNAWCLCMDIRQLIPLCTYSCKPMHIPCPHKQPTLPWIHTPSSPLTQSAILRNAHNLKWSIARRLLSFNY